MCERPRASAREPIRKTARMSFSARHGCALLMTAALLAGCGGEDDWSAPHAEPRAGSWDQVHPPEGYRVVLLTAGEDAPAKTIADAVRRWADAEDVSLKTVKAANAGDHVASITRAMRLEPDLIVCAGNALVDP